MKNKITYKNTPAFQKLNAYFETFKSKHMRILFQEDDNRFEKYHVQFENILFDYSKNRIDDTIISDLIALAHEMQLPHAIENMFHGIKINGTEDRAVLHTALRNFSDEVFIVDGVNIMEEIRFVRNKMKTFSDNVNSGKQKGYSGKQFTDVVNIGIGGSDLGPVMVCEALKHYANPKIKMHFVSNVDGTQIVETLNNLNPETTLFLIASKTFTTQETMTNAHTARNWFLETAKDEKHVEHHFVALSTAEKEVIAFGINKENMFEFWDWVGGRYSLWSAIGLSIAISIGYDNFEQLLKGAEASDNHFAQTEYENNIPVLMGLIGFWYNDFFHFNAQIIIPYDQYMHRFTAYLQQADMESNGKSVDQNGNRVDYATGPIIWGEPGTNGQHAFYQLLHQGTQIIPADFIAPAISLNPIGDHHPILLSNFLAQTEAFMNGKTADEVKKELKAKGMDDDTIEKQFAFRVFEGNRPSNSFLIDKITPYNLGALIALYEHKIFVQGVLWNIFSFDQWGVELGKKLAQAILPELHSEKEITNHDSSTNGLIKAIKKIRK